MEKKFKPFDKVIIREDKNSKWICDFYSHNDNWTKECWCLGIRVWIGIDNILPYEGNEHLVGTDQNPDEEVRLEDDEWVAFEKKEADFTHWGVAKFDYIDCDLLDNGFFRMKPLSEKEGYSITADKVIRFSDFNPNDMEATKAKILCVKNGKIVKYKN